MRVYYPCRGSALRNIAKPLHSTMANPKQKVDRWSTGDNLALPASAPKVERASANDLSAVPSTPTNHAVPNEQ